MQLLIIVLIKKMQKAKVRLELGIQDIDDKIFL